MWQYNFGFGRIREYKDGDVTMVYDTCSVAGNFDHVVICIDYGPKSGMAHFLEDIAHVRNGTALGLVHIGSEPCDNDWLKPLLRNTTLDVRFMFLVYGTSRAFDTTAPTLVQLPPIFHWPLGPAYVSPSTRK